MTELQSLLEQTRSTLDEAWLGARLLSPMLGADGPRTYLVVFQNNAEARGTGGLIGAYAVISASKGAVTVERLGSVADLASLTAPALNLGPDYQALYGSDPGLWVNVNMSPHFPYAAQLMAAMWQRQFGTSLDGVIATDPVALSYLLQGDRAGEAGRRVAGDRRQRGGADHEGRLRPLAAGDAERAARRLPAERGQVGVRRAALRGGAAAGRC